MKPTLHLKNFNQKSAYLGIAFFLVAIAGFAQEPLPTTNTVITGVTVESVWDEEITDSKDNNAGNAIDGDVDTDWAGQGTEGNNTGGDFIFDLNGSYDLAEIQYLTVTKSPAYEFQIWVSTSGTAEGDFTNVYDDTNLEANLDNTYKSFSFGPIAGATFVKIKCYGRSDSAWSTISEILFYESGTASVKDNDFAQYFSLYPNPAANFINIVSKSVEVTKVQVYNVTGQLVIDQAGLVNKGVDVSTLSRGVYVLKLTSADNQYSKRIMIE